MTERPFLSARASTTSTAREFAYVGDIGILRLGRWAFDSVGLEARPGMKDGHFTPLGFRHIWGGEEPFGIPPEHRPYHAYIVGQTGTGKSTMLWNLLIDDIYAGRGVGLIDPHGDMASKLLDYIPPERTRDVVYFNPADLEYPMGLNLLGPTPPGMRHVVASDIVNSFKCIWKDSWGARLEYIFTATVSTLLDCQNVSLLGVQRILNDTSYRRWAQRQIKNPRLQSFWADEFEEYDRKYRLEAIAPIQNKVGQLLMAWPVCNILGQVKCKSDMRFIMDNRRIFIANLSKGLLGPEPSKLLGAMLVSQFQHAAMSRAAVPANNRVPFHLVIDEFQNFSTDSFAEILSEMRKYGLSLTLAHQYTSQLETVIRDAVFGNVGTTISFRVGHEDAEILSRQYGDELVPKRFTELANFNVCVKPLSIGGNDSSFFGRTMPSSGQNYGCSENLINQSRKRYATERTTVEGKIENWLSDRVF